MPKAPKMLGTALHKSFSIHKLPSAAPFHPDAPNLSEISILIKAHRLRKFHILCQHSWLER